MPIVHDVPAASVFLFFSAALCLFLTFYAFLQRRDAFTTYFIGLMLVSCIYTLGYGAELLSANLDEMKQMLRIQYLGIPFLSVTWVGMAWGYLDSRGLPRRYLIAMTTASIAMALVFQTNDSHHLFYADLQYTHVNGLAIAYATKGPLYWLHIAYLNLCIAVGMALFFRAWRQSMRIYQLQSLCLLIGSVFPWGFHLLYLAGLSPYQIDLGPFGLAITGIFSAIAFFRHGILDILPVARDLVFDGIAEGVVVLDNRNQIADFNRAAAQFVPGLNQQAIGRQLADIDGGKPIMAHIDMISTDASSRQEANQGIGIGTGDQERFFRISLSQLKDRDGGTLCRALLMIDVTEKRKLLEQMQRLAMTDPLTGLFNRRQIDTQGRHLFSLARRNRTPFSIAIIDIDHFKRINDQQGHQAGDEVLRQISSLIVNRLRTTDVIGRFGGDEFVIGLPGTALVPAVQLMLELNDTCRNTTNITLSIGVAEQNQETPDFDALINQADDQLYQAKSAGRDQVMPTRTKMPSGLHNDPIQRILLSVGDHD